LLAAQKKKKPRTPKTNSSTKPTKEEQGTPKTSTHTHTKKEKEKKKRERENKGLQAHQIQRALSICSAPCTERKRTALLQIQDLDDLIFGQERVPSV
jgi:hypothetical protein